MLGGHACLQVSDDFHVGDRVKLVRKAPGLWEVGDMAVVIGLGTSQGPITIRLDKDARTIHSQPYYLLVRQLGRCSSVLAPTCDATSSPPELLKPPLIDRRRAAACS